METVAKKQSFRRKSMLSCFAEQERGAKNHKEFFMGQKEKPVGMYARPAGHFGHQANIRSQYTSITRS